MDHELDAGGCQQPPRAVEIVHTEEEPDPPERLVPDGRRLKLPPARASKDARLGAWRPDDDDPPFGRPSFVCAGESSTSSKPRTVTKNSMAGSYPVDT